MLPLGGLGAAPALGDREAGGRRQSGGMQWWLRQPLEAPEAAVEAAHQPQGGRSAEEGGHWGKGGPQQIARYPFTMACQDGGGGGTGFDSHVCGISPFLGRACWCRWDQSFPPIRG